MMKVKDIMSEPIIVVREEDTLFTVANLMLDNRIGGLPVVDGQGKMVGIVTESDLAAKEHAIPFSRFHAPQLFGKWMSDEGIENAYEAARNVKVNEIMSSPGITVEEDDTLAEVERKMLKHRIHHLPVVKDSIPVGMITRFDLLRLIVREIGPAKSED